MNALLPMELPQTSSVAASLAKISARREDRLAWAKEQGADCGANASVLLANYDPISQSLKTSQTCFLDQAIDQEHGLAEYSQTWPPSGMMRNGKIYRRQPWALPICANVSGLLPTPLKNTAGKSEHTLGLVLAGLSQMTLDRYWRINFSGDPNLPWIEWMMGFPENWTAMEPSETP